jgi:hypothetical protein
LHQCIERGTLLCRLRCRLCCAPLGSGTILKTKLEPLRFACLLRLGEGHTLFSLAGRTLGVPELLLALLCDVDGFGCTGTLQTTGTTEDVVARPEVRDSQSHGSLLYATPPNKSGAARVVP